MPNDPKKVQRNFVLLIENPDVFLCLRLQKYFENTVDIKPESQPSDIPENKVRVCMNYILQSMGHFIFPFNAIIPFYIVFVRRKMHQLMYIIRMFLSQIDS